ncbi:MAG: hypothetical protein K2Y23_15245 [Cyanobacteria bacterium]|nr:hypothetical protein [Cyanobacteriota bacterium]
MLVSGAGGVVRPNPIAAAIYLCLLFATQVGCNSASRIEPVSGILDAFQSHQIVALGEGLHGNTQSHAFRLTLVRDPRFVALVNDIVVEFGSARHQAVMDRFTGGGDVPAVELRKAWQDTTQHGLWDSPIYEEFFRAVRDVNASLPPERELRVLLGDPPIDWDAVRSPHDLGRWNGLRDTHAADLIDREVLSKNRRALVIYGDGHFRRHTRWAGMSDTRPTLLNLIERKGVKAFAVWTNTTVELDRIQRNIASWPIPSLAIVRGTRLGTINFKYFAGMETDPPTNMEDQFDAVLYLGPPSSITMSEMSAALCADAEFTKMRVARLGLGPGGPDGEDVARFKKECADALRQQPK